MDDVRREFPIYGSRPQMVYLDSAATSLKPQSVLDRMMEYYTHYTANIHRGLYETAEKSSAAYESVRTRVANFIHAKPEEVVFTKGATEGLNLIAQGLAHHHVRAGSHVVTTILEHHANFIPWQEVARERNARFSVVTFDTLHATEDEILQAFESHITRDTSVLALTHVSNAIGVTLPVMKIIKMARTVNPDIIIVLDVCQSIYHHEIDVASLDVDALSFSAHKCFGPTGAGVVYGKKRLLEELPPYQYGGDMIDEVTIDTTTYAHPPHRFEAGTPPIAEVIGMGAAIEYLTTIGQSKIHDMLTSLRGRAVKELRSQFDDTIEIYDNPHLEQSSILSFNLRNVHAHDTAQLLAERDVCIRAGHHCAQPLHTQMGIPATCRASLSIYNTTEDISRLREGIDHILSTFT